MKGLKKDLETFTKTLGFKKSKVEVMREDGLVGLMNGLGYKGLYFHKSVDGGDYTITHLSSGRRVISGLKFKDCRPAIARLSRLENWQKPMEHLRETYGLPSHPLQNVVKLLKKEKNPYLSLEIEEEFLQKTEIGVK